MEKLEKHPYEKPSLEIICFCVHDIMTTSPPGGTLPVDPNGNILLDPDPNTGEWDFEHFD